MRRTWPVERSRMGRGWLLGILLARVALSGRAHGPEVATEKARQPEGKFFSFELECLGFGTHAAFFEDSFFRAVTDYLGIPEDRVDLHTRPQVTLKYRWLSGVAKPRWAARVSWPQGYGQGDPR